MNAALPLPPFCDPAHAASWDFRPDEARVLAAARAWKDAHAIPPAGSDRANVRLLIVDAQKDFCFPRGALFVGGRSGRGAMEDNDRLARFIYANLARLTEITCTLDTHYPHQVFFPSFWVDGRGGPLAAHREVTSAEVRRGDVAPSPEVAWWVAGGDVAWLRAQAIHYCEELERRGKYRLYLWPPHCLLGSDGHALAGVIHEARLFHAGARGARDGIEIKGGAALTENYSVFAPEVLFSFDGRRLAARNEAFLDEVFAADALIIAGQAASHCVKSSLEDLIDEARVRDPGFLARVYVLRDCTSAVAVPDPASPGKFLFDFTPDAEAALARFAAAGVHLVRSTEPMESWPQSANFAG